jgi:hypothetical protein
VQRVAKRIIGRYGLSVLDGPFKGLKYVPASAGSVFAPKLVGSYEAEIQPLIREAISDNCRTVVDIGCAEGYYAVGLMVAMPQATCIAFDVDTEARALCARMAALNGVADRISIHGKCECQALNGLNLEHAFVICDCEGAEFELLNPALVPFLRACHILVEVHECFRPGLTSALREWFAASHSVSLISVSKRDPSHYPHLSFLDRKDRALAVEESRPPGLLWAMMTPLARTTSAADEPSVGTKTQLTATR